MSSNLTACKLFYGGNIRLYSEMDVKFLLLKIFMFYYDYDEAIENGIILKSKPGLNKYHCFVDKVLEEMAELLEG